ncbi:hypothetical protein FACS1894170_13090 [Planctomycetales bacterium]|nr:hypothetical protein FACS1894170_13090 [Planctomycetales bacterium]
MSEFFQIQCPFCDVKLNAKVKHIGKTKKCPKCNGDIFVENPDNLVLELNEPFVPQDANPFESISLRPAQLELHDRYFILGSDRIAAVWSVNDGWKVNVGSGFAPARSNQTAIPDQGVFAFVHLKHNDGIPAKLAVNRIASRGALMAIVRDENGILRKLEDTVELNVNQKDVLMRYLRQIYMADVLDQAQDVLNSLSIIQANVS